MISVALVAAVAAAPALVRRHGRRTDDVPAADAHARGTRCVDTARRHLHDGSCRPVGTSTGSRSRLTSHERVTSRSAFEATVHGESLAFRADAHAACDSARRPSPRGSVRTPHRVVLARRSQHPPARQRRLPARGTAAGRQRPDCDRLRDARGGGRPCIAPAGAARRRVGVAARRRPGAARSTAPPTPTSSRNSSRAGGSAGQAALIGGDTDVPLTLAPSPETLDSWATLAQTTDDIELAARRRRRAPRRRARTRCCVGPFVPLDLPSLFSGRARRTDSPTSSTGARTPSSTFFGRHIDPSTAMPGPPRHATSLTPLGAASRTRLVVDGNALDDRSTARFTPAHPARLARGNGDDDDRGGRHRFRAPGASSTATNHRRCAPRTCLPRSRSSPASSRASHVGSPSPTRPTGIPPASTFVARAPSGSGTTRCCAR